MIVDRLSYCLPAALVLLFLTACGDRAQGGLQTEKAAEEKAAKAPVKETPSAPPTAEDKIRDVLRRKQVKGLVWEEADLDDAMAYLRTITGVNFYVSTRARDEKLEDVVITLKVDSVSVSSVLDKITNPFGLRWEVRGKVVHILTNGNLSGKPIRRRYDVKDLVPAAAEPDEATSVKRASAFEGEKALIEDLRREVLPAYWELSKDAVLDARNGMLTVDAAVAVHEVLEAYLARERREVQFHEMPEALRKKLQSTEVNLDVDSQVLGEVIKILQITTAMNFTIDQRIVADLQELLIRSLHLHGVALKTALDMLAADCGDDVLWRAQGSVLVLTRKEFLPGG